MKKFERTYHIRNRRLDIYENGEYIDIDVYENENNVSYSPYRYPNMYILSGSLNTDDICRQNGLARAEVIDVLKKYSLWYVKANFKIYNETEELK
jgi:hypothetical protein